MLFLLIPFLLNIFICSIHGKVRKEIIANQFWDVNPQNSNNSAYNLKIRNFDHPQNKFHSCYHVKCEGKDCGKFQERRFCYPALIITGFPKCATSAMYDLLARFPNVVQMFKKEMCPFRSMPLELFFHNMPLAMNINEKSIIIDGCIDINANMKMRLVLREPKTFYIVMIRDYANMMWSIYNFWCQAKYDPAGCNTPGHYAKKGVHIRSPDIFHELIEADVNGNISMIQPFNHRPCIQASNFFIDYIEGQLEPFIPKNRSIIISSEVLEADPMHVAQQVAGFVHALDIKSFNIGNFDKIRINSQQKKGSDNSIRLSKFQPGIYDISGNRPMLNKTREILNRCWYKDCRNVGIKYGYIYSTCHNETV